MGLFGPPNIDKLVKRKNVKQLIRALAYEKDYRVNQGAARGLGEIGDARAVEALIAALNEGKDYLRRVAAEALGKIGDARAIQPLIKATGPYWPKDHFWDYGAVLDHNYVCKNAVFALVKISGADAVKPLVDAITGWDRDWGYEAEKSLRGIVDPRAVEPLISALKEQNRDVRSAAAEALGRIRAPRAVETLLAALMGGGSNASYASTALGRIGDARAVVPLIAALRSEDEHVRKSAAIALGDIGDARAIEPLIAALRAGDENLKGEVAGALARLGSTRAVDPLAAALGAGGTRIGPPLANALDKLGWKPRHDRVGAAYWLAKKDWEKCIEIGKPSVEPLIAVLMDGSPKDSEAAAEALVRIGGDLTVGRLTAVLKESDEKVGKSEVCVRAIVALGRIGGARVVEPLVNALRHGYGYDSGMICAATALGQIGDRRAVEALIARLQEGLSVMDGHNESTPVAAAGALGRIGDPRAIEPLVVALGYSSFSVRVAAATSLVQLYQRGRIDETCKRRILSQRGRIMEPHSKKFVDTTWDHISYHYEDVGIGVDFPV